MNQAEQNVYNAIKKINGENNVIRLSIFCWNSLKCHFENDFLKLNNSFFKIDDNLNTTVTSAEFIYEKAMHKICNLLRNKFECEQEYINVFMKKMDILFKDYLEKDKL